MPEVIKNIKWWYTLCPTLRLDVMSVAFEANYHDWTVCVVYGIAAKRTFYGYSQWSMQSTAGDITSNLEIKQNVGIWHFNTEKDRNNRNIHNQWKIPQWGKKWFSFKVILAWLKKTKIWSIVYVYYFVFVKN